VGNELEDARKRFRSVLRLNILLSTINGGGHPTLDSGMERFHPAKKARK
jgi:hypothetical protein